MELFSRKTKKDDFQQANLPEVTLGDCISFQLAQQADCTLLQNCGTFRNKLIEFLAILNNFKVNESGRKTVK